MTNPTATDPTGDPIAVANASRRLTLALEALEAAIEQRLDSHRDGAQIADQIHALGVDRSRLASELDTQMARTRRLEAANREVGQRIDAAMDSVRAVLDGKS